MPDFDTRRSQGPDDSNRLTITSIADKLRSLLNVTNPRLALIANRLRSLPIANGFSTLLVGSGVLLFMIVTVSVGLIMYSSDGRGSQQQAVGDTNSKPLTGGCLHDYGSESRSVGGFRYSPKGQKIVFVSNYSYDSDSTSGPASAPGTSGEEADNEICVVNADGTRMIRLTDDSTDEYSAVWSPDGEKIAFIRQAYGAPSSIVIMEADGSHMVELPGTETANWGVPNGLDWSPDGANIAYASGGCDIYITRADGSGTPWNLTSDPAWQCSESPAWSPDGKWMAFQSERGSNPDAVGDRKDIYVMNASGEGGANQWRQITDEPAQDAFPAWSPDGSEIAFTRYQYAPGPSEIYTVDADGSMETRLISGSLPTWVPDTEQIAFSGPEGIYRMNSDGSDVTLVVARDKTR